MQLTLCAWIQHVLKLNYILLNFSGGRLRSIGYFQYKAVLSDQAPSFFITVFMDHP